jgi:hypothetical protein
MNISNDNLDSVLIKISDIVNYFNINLLLSFIFLVGMISLISNSIKEGSVEINTVLMVIICSLFIYFYLKKEYSSELRKYKLKNKLNVGNNLLEELCENEKTKNKEICNSYVDAKNNYSKITTVLLEQYKKTLK